MAEPQTGPSYVQGEASEPMLGLTIGAALDRAAALWPEREALVSPSQGVRWSWRDFHARVEAFAAGLIALGLEPGERIGVWSLNNAEWAVAQFAAAKAGLVFVTINPAYRLHELEYALNKVGCRALILARQFKTSDYAGMLAALAPELATAAPGALAAARLAHLRIVIEIGETPSPGAFAFGAVMRLGAERGAEAVRALGPLLQFDEAANIQFTSGTTGAPKGVTLSHHNILNNGYFVGLGIKLTERDRVCIPVPLYHCFGMVMGNLACVAHGAAMIYPGEGFDPLATLKAAAAERCTALYGVPTMFIAMLDHPAFGEFDLSALRTGIMAGSPCPVELMRRVIGRMNLREVTICYGMTETSPVSFQSATDDPIERRVSTVGRVHPHLEVKVIDAAGRIVPRGETGELCTRGYAVMLGYWDEAARTAEVIDAGRWMHTGDLARIDAGGFCNIVGRIKDLVIRGGENIYPREVEEFLYRHPRILDVQVFGVPDAKYGEELCAWIRLREEAAPSATPLTAEDIRAFCAGQIAHQKIPRYVECVDAFPMTITGKVQKFLMREAMIERLGLTPAQTA